MTNYTVLYGHGNWLLIYIYKLEISSYMVVTPISIAKQAMLDCLDNLDVTTGRLEFSLSAWAELIYTRSLKYWNSQKQRHTEVAPICLLKSENINFWLFKFSD